MLYNIIQINSDLLSNTIEMIDKKITYVQQFNWPKNIIFWNIKRKFRYKKKSRSERKNEDNHDNHFKNISMQNIYIYDFNKHNNLSLIIYLLLLIINKNNKKYWIVM